MTKNLSLEHHPGSSWTREESRENSAAYPTYIGVGRIARILSGELSNHLIPRCNRDACVSPCFSLYSPLFLPPSSPGAALRSDQTSFRFRLSVSARFVSCTLRPPLFQDDAGRAGSIEDGPGLVIARPDYARFFPPRDAIHFLISSPSRAVSESSSFFENESRRRTSTTDVDFL